MVGWRETSPVQLNNKQRARFCAFKTEPFAYGHTAEIHKGKLFLPYEEKPVVVKIYPEDLNECKECETELRKQRLAQQVLDAFPDDLKSLKMVPKFKSTVGGCSALHRLITRDPLEEGTPVLIQERVNDHKIDNFEELGLAKIAFNPLRSLVEKSLAFSNGSFIIIGTKGFVTSENGQKTYHLTSLVVHSRDKSYGHADAGPEGLRRFLEESEIKAKTHDDGVPLVQRRRPSAPPVEEDPNNNVEQLEKINGDTKTDINGNNFPESVIESWLGMSGKFPPPYETVLNNNTPLFGPPPPYTS